VLGRYRMLERLGSGGFGVVWRARDELLGREVAVKRIALERGADGARAAREAQAGARLAHPSVVALYEACAEDDAFYLISELVRGETLARLIATRALRDREILEIGLALSDALSHAHARGVIHRDVKPQNVLVPDRPVDGGPSCTATSGVAKLTDFGGARLAGEDVLTRTGDVLGTLAYMAPEQSDGREAAEAADLYSLALVLYEALSGSNPVRGATPAETARRIGSPLPPLGRARRDLDRELVRSLDRALSPSPSDRGTLEQLRDALQVALEHGRLDTRRRRRLPATVLARQPLRDDVVQSAPSAPPARRQAPASVGERALSPEPAEPQRREAVPAVRAPRLPRALWLGCAAALAAWQMAAGRPGVGLLVLAAAAPLAALPRRAGAGWLSCALAPALGAVGLAGAYPAIAGQASRWTARAGLAALGYWWLALAQPLLAQRLWLGEPGGVPARAAWEGSLAGAGAHAIGPLLSLAVVLGAALWAAGAAVLPWIVRGRRAALDIVAATIWSALLAGLAPALDGGPGVHADPRGLAGGAVLGAMLAVAARALRGPV
jgi:eukaryotic-like serine/threonine-protein kinase